MAVAIANALDDGLDFHVTPDGQGRKTVKNITISEFPSDPETRQEVDQFFIAPNELGLPYLENVEIDVSEDSAITAEFDGDTASILIKKVPVLITDPQTEEEIEAQFAGAKLQVTAYGPPEFKHVDPTR